MLIGFGVGWSWAGCVWRDVWLAELSRLLPELIDRYPDLPPPTSDENLARTRLLEAVARLIPGGADAVIETSGTPEGIRTAVEIVRRAGRVVVIGLSGGLETPIRFDELVWNSISLICGLGQAAPQMRETLADAAPVDLQLRFTRAARADAAAGA